MRIRRRRPPGFILSGCSYDICIERGWVTVPQRGTSQAERREITGYRGTGLHVTILARIHASCVCWIMSRTARISVSIVAALLALSILSLLLLSWYLSTDSFKSWLETKSSRAMGMELQIQGDLRVDLFPVPHLTLYDVHLRNRGTELGSAEEVRLRVALLPLLVRRVDITDMFLDRPSVFIQRGTD